MSEMDKDIIEALCASDPHWAGALQVLQLARQQGGDPVGASTQLVCALVILSTEVPGATGPTDFLALCANQLLSTPLGKR